MNFRNKPFSIIILEQYLNKPKIYQLKLPKMSFYYNWNKKNKLIQSNFNNNQLFLTIYLYFVSQNKAL